ncbi:3-hydroxyisobutyrate dehydrogenase [Pseudonocardiaceae bacterium YIM PH 21723]|nr:3-hydroxyisobutyrate dehydrogenase [Pseudonocardiaceae bacterium YIM PH 21723]
MAVIGFIGLGNMGGPMAANLVTAGHEVHGFDLVPAALEAATAAGVTVADSAAAAVRDAEFVITMLPSGKHVLGLYADLLAAAKADALFIDSSTIDVADARQAAEAAATAGFPALDAPVSGGVGGAAAGTLTFMVGGGDADFERAKPVLDIMGGKVIHCGQAGAGQAAKICNNMLLGITMIGTCEAFVLGEKLGLTHRALFDVMAVSSGQSWSVTTYAPVPEVVPASPANRDYQPGFAVPLMLKDLDLAKNAAEANAVYTELGKQAAELYRRFSENGGSGLDFSAIINDIRERSK